MPIMAATECPTKMPSRTSSALQMASTSSA